MPKFFRTPYNLGITSHSSRVGSRYYHDVHLRHTPDGNMYLEKGKEHDRQAEINSYQDSCDVDKLIRRYENGDSTALIRNKGGAFVDLSSLPKTQHEAYRLSRDLELAYSELSGDLKDKFPTFSDFSKVFTDKDKLNSYLKYKSSRVKKEPQEVINNA